MAQTAKDGLWTHLPPRPWRYRGMTIETYQACQGASAQPGYACDHCRTGIKETHWFESLPTGKRFGVGSTCVYKMLREMRTKSLSAAERQIRKIRREKARERSAKKRSADRRAATISVYRARLTLRSEPHPIKWRAEQGDTRYDWARWMLRHGGGRAYRQVLAYLQ